MLATLARPEVPELLQNLCSVRGKPCEDFPTLQTVSRNTGKARVIECRIANFDCECRLPFALLDDHVRMRLWTLRMNCKENASKPAQMLNKLTIRPCHTEALVQLIVRLAA